MSDFAIIEVVFALCRHYEFSRAGAAEAIEGLMALTQIDCNRVMFTRALPFFTDHPTLSFEDCCMVAHAELSNAAPLWTFDKKLAGQARSARLVPRSKLPLPCSSQDAAVRASPLSAYRHSGQLDPRGASG